MTNRTSSDRRSWVWALLLFGLIWLIVGFISGTGLLRGPLGWLVEEGRAAGWSTTLERVVVSAIIVVYVVGSAIVAFLLYRFQRDATRGVRASLLVVGVGAMAFTLWLWMNPDDTVPQGAFDPSVDGRFAFGPYPTAEIMDSLQARGFTGIVSLLHPAVVPFEPRLLNRERELAAEHGLELVSTPMLPWVADNEASLEQIRRLAEEGEGKYYVHCYLGRDRISVVRTVLQEAVGEETGDIFSDREELERGRIFRLEDEVYLTPLPTGNEFFSYVVPGAAAVLSLLDPENDAELRRLEDERTALGEADVPLHEAPISSDPFDPEQAVRAAELARSLPRPLIVHAYLSEGTAAEAFLQAYVYGGAPLPPSLVDDPVVSVSYNAVVGPRPDEVSLRDLWLKGVRDVVYWGSLPPESPELQETAEAARATGMGWHHFQGDVDDLVGSPPGNGPRYLFGDRAEEARSELSERLPPPLPEPASADGGGR